MDEQQPTLPVPPFPWASLRYVMSLSGAGFSSNTRPNPVPMSVHRVFGQIPWSAMETAQYGPVMTAVARAFMESDKRYGLLPIHWRVLMGCQAGLVEKPDAKGIPRWCFYWPERPEAVLPYHEAARLFGRAEDLIKRYEGEAKRAIEQEWRALHTSGEK